MKITYKHHSNIIIAYKQNAIDLFRVLRAALWAQGDKRDPKPGDMINGVTLVSIDL